MNEEQRPELPETDPITEQEDAKQSSKSSQSPVLREVISWVKTIVIAIIIVLLLQNFVLINATIPSGSMISTMNINDRVFAFRLSYLFSDPERGDIIVFKDPDDPSQKLTKRIIGMPGDTVEVVDGKVYLNGLETPLDEPYINETPVGDFGPYTVPEDSYFMMGDNRNNSLDSRYWQNTYLKRDGILGKVIFKYYPKIELLTDK